MSLSAGSTIARACSGSRSSIRSIEPLMSANSAVTVLRSPSSASGAASEFTRIAERSSSARVDDAGEAIARAAPHSRQNLKGAVFSTPHLGHLTAKGPPHSPQNLVLDGFSDPHLAHRIPDP